MSGVLDPTVVPTASSVVAGKLNTTVTTTSSLALLPSPRDLFLLPIRAFQHAETFAFNTVPRHIGRMVGVGDINLNLWPAPAPSVADGSAVAEAMGVATEAVAGTAGGVAQAATQAESWYLTEFMNTMRKVGGFFGYLTSVWSMACLVEVCSYSTQNIGAPLTCTGPDPEPHHDIRIDSTSPSTGMGEKTSSSYCPHPSLRIPNHVLVKRDSLPVLARLCYDALRKPREDNDIRLRKQRRPALSVCIHFDAMGVGSSSMQCCENDTRARQYNVPEHSIRVIFTPLACFHDSMSELLR